jgi:hypothetical protein
MTDKPNKPLKGKAYGSIAHLPGSRMGPADHHCHTGQEVICCTKGRDRHDRIIVTEKLDGACVSVANVEGKLVPLIRAGYTAIDAKYDHLRQFNSWATDNEQKFAKLKPGERVIGEWISMAHGTVYRLTHDPFVAFDCMTGPTRWPHDMARAFFTEAGIVPAHVIHDGGPIAVSKVMENLSGFGFHGATEPVEGAVWRVERRGVYDFMAKYVRPDKADGKYLPNISGEPPIWHWPMLAGEAA